MATNALGASGDEGESSSVVVGVLESTTEDVDLTAAACGGDDDGDGFGTRTLTDGGLLPVGVMMTMLLLVATSNGSGTVRGVGVDGAVGRRRTVWLTSVGTTGTAAGGGTTDCAADEAGKRAVSLPVPVTTVAVDRGVRRGARAGKLWELDSMLLDDIGIISVGGVEEGASDRAEVAGVG